MVLCALLSACSKWMNSKRKQKRKTLVKEAFGAAVAGVAVFMLHMWQGIDTYLCGIIALGSGYVGSEGVERVLKQSAAAAAKKAGIPVEEPKKDDKEEKK